MTADPAQEFFCEGISEDIITDLSKIEGIGVIGRQSAFAYKGKANDLRRVCLELGVRYVLEGSVRKAGTQIRVTAQLIKSRREPLRPGPSRWTIRTRAVITPKRS